MLHVKLNKEACNVNTATLYDGSILEFDSRLYDIDIGTCLEVLSYYVFCACSPKSNLSGFAL